MVQPFPTERRPQESYSYETPRNVYKNNKSVTAFFNFILRVARRNETQGTKHPPFHPKVLLIRSVVNCEATGSCFDAPFDPAPSWTSSARTSTTNYFTCSAEGTTPSQKTGTPVDHQYMLAQVWHFVQSSRACSDYGSSSKTRSMRSSWSASGCKRSGNKYLPCTRQMQKREKREFVGDCHARWMSVFSASSTYYQVLNTNSTYCCTAVP